MGVAWTAMKLGQKAVIYMPKGSSVERVERIRKTGATVHVTDVNYDATVELAKATAEKTVGPTCRIRTVRATPTFRSA